MKDELYLEVHSLDKICLAPIETIITLFNIKYCDSNIAINLILSNRPLDERLYPIDISNFTYQLANMNSVPTHVKSCKLPTIINKTKCIAGLCAILRQIIKHTIGNNKNHRCSPLLGFKGSCLLACTESSVWTKYCEVDLINTLKYLDETTSTSNELPLNIVRFEHHMSQPIKLHNLYKYSMSKKFMNEHHVPEHLYAEGSHITLADIIIFVCVHLLINVLSNKILDSLSLTNQWYERLVQDEIIMECLACLPVQETNTTHTSYVVPIIPNQSLYKSDPKRYKAKSRSYTKQEDIELSLELIKNLTDIEIDKEPFGVELLLDWNNIPFDAKPEGGALPLSRLRRKTEQLENLCKPVLKMAKPGHVIVDFCSGGGHLGILLAVLLPNCTVILLENKEESLNRAKERVEKLKLTNVEFYQCNLDYFYADFDIGTALHACGVATDLVIQKCIKKNAIFVTCPCCYGSLHNCHRLTYPRSDLFKNQIDSKMFTVLCHAADQTHDKQNAKTPQGYKCMSIVDVDRKIYAEQFDYQVHLSKLIPETCTPKNHILVGIPKIRSVIHIECKD